MDSWMALVSILAVVAIVVVTGGIIALIGNLVLGTLNGRKINDTKDVKEVYDYEQYKRMNQENQVSKVAENDYDFDAINMAKAQEEMKQANSSKAEEIFKFDEEEDDDLSKLEERLKNSDSKNKDESVDDILDEISNSIVEEEKQKVVENGRSNRLLSNALSAYNIDDVLNKQSEEESEDEESLETLVNEQKDEQVEEVVNEIVKQEPVVEEKSLAMVAQEPVAEAQEPIVEEVKVEDNRDEEIEALKAQLEALNKQLESARTPVESITIDMTEEQCLDRLALYEERLKNAKRDYKVNMKEFKPLEKVKRTLEKYKPKLRRKEAIAAKNTLYGVNNYDDIDKEKAEKLANELELLDGLRLSVSHCEEVMNANKDRYPVLEHANKILAREIENIENDIEYTKTILKSIRDKKDNEGSEGSKE